MRTEEECKPQNRFLFTDEIFSDESIEIWKGECITRMNSRNLEKNKAFNTFVSWKKTDMEIALFTSYAHADFKIPKPFNCIFELNNPENAVFTNFKLTQSIYEGWYPIDNVEDGHKHLCIFSFENEVPEIFNKLHIGKGKFSDVPKGAIKLGICNQNDFKEIKERQVYVNRLRKKYGLDWSKFDKEVE